ncbi:MAG: fumarylacetoacetate hydrolase family protein [Bdellovibrionota bacterium]
MLNGARLEAKPVAQLTQQMKTENQEFLRSDAYGMQEAQLFMRTKAGEKQIGWKMGLTSEAKRRQMNLDSPLYGFLTDQMKVESGSTFSLQGKIHPKIEPEIAFLIGQDLSAPVSREQVLGACTAVCACMEILDSRYQQFKYFSMEDVIADNSSSSNFVMGPWKKDFNSLDLTNLDMNMKVNGESSQKGNSRDISGDPVISVIQLCELLAERKQILKAGSIVLAGAATPAVELKAGMQVELLVEGLEPVTVKVSN